MAFIWKNLQYWKRGLIFGLIFGLLIYFFSLFFEIEYLGTLLWWLSGTIICFMFKADTGEGCAFTFVIFGWIILPLLYGLIGALIGLLIEKIKSKK
ncbi:hypothetical protein HQ529_04710 [Candidatus Woesearchaeota archaeon]|nr:hypothetical protein [Candidatus Woesearchaeota archaeon]